MAIRLNAIGVVEVLGTDILALIAMSAVASAVGGMLGMASGIFLVPILLMFGHLPIRTAIGLSLVSVIVCSCASAPAFLRARLINVRLAIVLEVATTAGALAGVVASGLFSARLLSLLFALVMLLSAWQMVRPRTVRMAMAGNPAAFARRLDGIDPDPAPDGTPYRIDRLPLAMGMMFGAGMLSALLGIGSGVLKIPAMDSALRLPIKVSSATSNFMIGVTAAAGAIAYFLTGALDLTRAAPICLGSVAGSIAGARALKALRPDRLRVMFVVILLVLAVQMALAAAGTSFLTLGGG
ncbi:sulfite exporter TauE/SafE family protein [Sphingobium yanoikuyae]|uniref:sulfite exporter TauE/SafE family protein n=2 Tax=Sphingobium TaxID=165695 RepID=UPI002FDDB4C7